MNKDKLRFVIVGHVDHGKSTLIGRLLFDTGSLPEEKIKEIKEICKSLGKEMEFGYVMDHLEEERMQGITIETAQTFFGTKTRDYIIIDAPGHVEFTKNMVTGASQAEAALLIVDASEGVKEQTKRHAYLLGLLGLKQIVVVINKMDLVNHDEKRFMGVKKEVLKFLNEIDIHPLYVIPISAKNGDNITSPSSNVSWYTGPTVLEALEGFKTSSSPLKKPLRFIVQDVLNFDKRIVVGRVETGKLKTGSQITVFPSGEKTIVNSLEEYGRTPELAEAGKSVGLTTIDKLFIERGNVIVDGGRPPAVSDRLRASLFWMDKKPYRKGETLRLRLATQEINCEIEEIESVQDSSTLELLSENQDEIKNREAAHVVIKTFKPLVVELFNEIEELGRFVLSREDTVAGGIVTGV